LKLQEARQLQMLDAAYKSAHFFSFFLFFFFYLSFIPFWTNAMLLPVKYYLFFPIFLNPIVKELNN